MSTIHVVRTAFLPVNVLGDVVDKNEASYMDMLQTEHQHRVLVDADIPNSASQPDMKDYLEAEALDGYYPIYVDQNTIVTALDMSAPAAHAKAVSASADFLTDGSGNLITTRALTASGAGTATVLTVNGESVSIYLAAGVPFPIRAVKVTAAAETGIVALW